MSLRDVTPAALAQLVEQRALEALRTARATCDAQETWASRIAMALSPGYDVRVVAGRIEAGECHGGTDLGLTAEALCRYAQTGDGWPDVPADAQAQAAEDALLTVVSTLTSPEDDAAPAEWSGHEETTDPLVLVARASLARIALARGEDVPRSWLAALSGVTGSTIRMAIARGTLEARPVERGGAERERSPITHATATQWLRARDPSQTGVTDRRVG